ncbi:MAG TPA: mycofactocin precursor MftA [Acidimicrobiales bacterium]
MVVEPTTQVDDTPEDADETAVELLVEEVSIDGLCGVY